MSSSSSGESPIYGTFARGAQQARFTPDKVYAEDDLERGRIGMVACKGGDEGVAQGWRGGRRQLRSRPIGGAMLRIELSLAPGDGGEPACQGGKRPCKQANL